VSRSESFLLLEFYSGAYSLGWSSGFLAGSDLGSGRGSDLACFPVTALRRGGMGAALSRLSGLQTVALSVQLQNVHVVREAVEEGTGEPLGSKDARPLLKR
jgi:hypothetical protein